MSDDKYGDYVSKTYGSYNVAAVARLLVILNNNMEKLEATNSKRNELLERLVKVEEEKSLSAIKKRIKNNQ